MNTVLVEVGPGQYERREIKPRPLPRRVHRDPVPLDPREKCGGESITTAADAADSSAPLCATCGAAWLRTVVSDWDASLPNFTGKATPAQVSAHAARIAERDAKETECLRKLEERRAATAARKAERARMTEREADERARKLLAVVTEQPRTIDGVAQALDLTVRTARRVVTDAKKRGYVSSRPGPGALIERAQQAQQPAAA